MTAGASAGAGRSTYPLDRGVFPNEADRDRSPGWTYVARPEASHQPSSRFLTTAKATNTTPMATITPR